MNLLGELIKGYLGRGMIKAFNAKEAWVYNHKYYHRQVQYMVLATYSQSRLHSDMKQLFNPIQFRENYTPRLCRKP
jgi:hypothetical protein